MEMKFKNESSIEIIPSEEYKRGTIRGRILTDRESKYMQELEIAKGYMKTGDVIKRLGLWVIKAWPNILTKCEEKDMKSKTAKIKILKRNDLYKR